MRQAIIRALMIFLKCCRATALFTGLVLVGAHYYFWGAIIFFFGVIALGLQEEGWA